MSGQKASDTFFQTSECGHTLKQETVFSDGQDGELDLPPEYCRYRDEGCELARSCLECPFPQCVWEQPRGKQRWLKQLRDREMVRLFTTEGKGVKELAMKFSVSQRTVQRALGRNSK